MKALLLSTLLLGGCSLLGITKPLTFDEKLASAYVVHTSVVNAATVAVSAHSISSAQAQKVADMAAQSRSLLDESKALETAGNVNGATNDLALATAALTALQSYLNQQVQK